MNVIIAGGGIGGLVTALCLHEAGISVQVFESVPLLKPLGAGINLLPHAVQELSRLGLRSELESIAIPTADLSYFNKSGELIRQEPRGRAAGHDWPQYSIHRGRLQMLLLNEAIARIGLKNVRTGCHLAQFEEREGQVWAQFVDPETQAIVTEVSADVLVGADGVHSTVRQTFYPDEAAPKWSGRLIWRGLSVAEPFLTGRSMVVIGQPDQRFVAYPIDPALAYHGHSLVNWIAELKIDSDTMPIEQDWNRKATSATFAASFYDWHFDWLDVQALIDSAEAIYAYPLVNQAPLPRWSFGRVTLLGDAAHPLNPISTDGASEAILDARALTDALMASAGDVPAALQAYEAARLEPTTQLALIDQRTLLQ